MRDARLELYRTLTALIVDMPNPSWGPGSDWGNHMNPPLT